MILGLVDDINTPILKPPKPPTGKKQLRRTERREAVLRALKRFRQTHWQENYKYCGWGPEVLLPDKDAAFLATNAHLKTSEDIQRLRPEWVFGPKLGLLALACADAADDAWFESQGKVNPAKVVKPVETQAEKTARYNANRREKRRLTAAMAKAKKEEEALTAQQEAQLLSVNQYNPSSASNVDVSGFLGSDVSNIPCSPLATTPLRWPALTSGLPVTSTRKKTSQPRGSRRGKPKSQTSVASSSRLPPDNQTPGASSSHLTSDNTVVVNDLPVVQASTSTDEGNALDHHIYGYDILLCFNIFRSHAVATSI